METIYAQALWVMIRNGMEPTKAVSRMGEKMTREGRGALLSRMGRAFRRIAHREIGRTALTLTVSDVAHTDSARISALARVSGTNVDTKHVEVRVDDSIIGGWRFEGNEMLIDASYKKYLLDMYHAITHAT